MRKKREEKQDVNCHARNQQDLNTNIHYNKTDHAKFKFALFSMHIEEIEYTGWAIMTVGFIFC